MGWYIRKSLSVGPLRFNLSKSGLGVSVGVRGFRIGTGPRGAYVHMGRGGLYYRKSLSFQGRNARNVEPQFVASEPQNDDWIATGDPKNPLSRPSQRNALMASAIWGSFTWAVLWFEVTLLRLGPDRLFADDPPALSPQDSRLVLGQAIFVALFAALRIRQFNRRKVPLLYSMEEGTEAGYRRLIEVFEANILKGVTWFTQSTQRVEEPYLQKVNAGTGEVVNRVVARVNLQGASHIASNIPIATIRFLDRALMLLPDQLVLIDGNGAAISQEWQSVQFSHYQGRFVEERYMPRNSGAYQVDTTFQYVNVDGSPDRRFKFNRARPVYLYSYLAISSLGLEFSFSGPDSAGLIGNALAQIDIRHFDSGVASDTRSRTAFEDAFMTFRGTALNLWARMKSIDEDSHRATVESMSITEHELDSLIVADAAHIYACVAESDGTISDEDRSLFDSGLKVAYRSGQAPAIHILNDIAASFDDRLTEGFRAFLGFDLQHGTDLADSYSEAAATLASELAGVLESPEEVEFGRVNEIRAAMTSALARKDARSTPAVPATAQPAIQASLAPKPEEIGARGTPEAMSNGAPGNETSAAVNDPEMHSQLPPAITHDELDRLVGLEQVKEEIREYVRTLHIDALQQKQDMAWAVRSKRLIFVGNLGSGRTTVATILAEMLHDRDVLSRGHVIEAGRLDLVGNSAPDTVARVRGHLEKARGGVLLIDEASSVLEETGTLEMLTGSQHLRNDLVVVLEGRPDPMNALMAKEVILEATFPRTVSFPDYAVDELLRIFQVLANQDGFVLDQPAAAAVRDRLESADEQLRRLNGRLMSMWLDEAKRRQMNRIALESPLEPSMLTALTAEDVGG